MIMSDNNNHNNHLGGWNIEFHSLPSHTHEDGQHDDHKTTSCTEDEGIILASISLSALFANDANAYHAFTGTTTNGRNETTDKEDTKFNVKVRAAKVALADYTARTLSNLLPINTSSSIKVQTMSQARHSHTANNNTNRSKLQRGRNSKRLLLSSKKKDEIPYV